MQVRVHSATPDWFLNKAVEVVQLGCGSPALYGDAGAMLRSAAALPAHRFTNGGALNIKFDARTVSGLVGRKALSSLIRTYLVDQHGLQVQINVLDAETLRKAKANPEAFPHLLVRVSGYCAYFADLQPEIQDEIIERTAHGLARG